jgi:hypothetical protein
MLEAGDHSGLVSRLGFGGEALFTGRTFTANRSGVTVGFGAVGRAAAGVELAGGF